MLNTDPTRAAVWTVMAFLLVALGPWPYPLYMALRVAVMVVCLLCAWRLRDHYDRWLPAALVVAAILYNPFLVAHLTRDVWAVINMATLFLLVITLDRLPSE